MNAGLTRETEQYVVLRVLARPRAALRARMPLAWRRRVAVVVGGLAGTGLRILIGDLLSSPVDAWHWGTFAANIAGALALGYLLTRFLVAAPRTTLTIPLLCIGALGALTTFSSLSVETWRLGQMHRPLVAAGYAGVTIFAGVVAALVGISVAERRA